MKKLFTLFLGLLLTVSFVQAQEYWDKYLINENFDGAVALPTGWSSLTANTTSTTAVFGRSGGTSLVDGIRFTGSGSGNRGAEIKIPLAPDSSTIYVDLDLLVAKSAISNGNSFQFYLLGSKSVNLWNTGTPYTDVIAGLFWVGGSGKFHLWNKDIKGPVPVNKPDTIIPVFVTGQYPSFRRAGTTTFKTDSLNLSTKTDVGALKNKWYNLNFKLNFATKKMDLTITQKDSIANTQTFTNLDFVSPTVSDFVQFGMLNNRASNIANHLNADLDATVDNFKVYQKVLSLGKADLTIKYIDQDGNEAKPSKVLTSQEVGLMYRLLESEKASFTSGGNYYAYSAAATGPDSVIVQLGGSTLTAVFKKTPQTSGTYTWKGFTSEYWNELDANFTTNLFNQLAYQNGNGVKFSLTSAAIKDVSFSSKFDLGANSMSIDVPDYTISGTGVLFGTGAINVNASTTLSFMSKLTGGLNLNKGTLQVKNYYVTNKYNVKSGTTLNVNIGSTVFSTPITGTGIFTVMPTAQVEYNSTVKGVSEIYYSLPVKGNIAAMNKMPRMNFALDSLAKINVISARGDSTTYFGTTLNYKNNRIHLGDSIGMVYSVNPATGGTTNILIGELTGTAKSKLVGPNVRTMTYTVGGLNTNAEFAGELAPINIDAWAGNTTYNIAKTGKGTWTLSGASPYFYGNVKVLDGTLVVNNVLCDGLAKVYTVIPTATGVPTSITLTKIAEVLVADTATLAGNGYIGAIQNTVNGTITGNLTLGGTLSLKQDLGAGGATTIINATASGVDKITIEGDLNYGGKLIVRATGQRPAPGDYKILDAANYIESGEFGFDSIELPSTNWSFDFATGTLTYKGGDDTAVSTIDYSKSIDSMEYFDMTGRKVSGYQKGMVFVKVKYTDGTSGVYKTFITK
ncbi:MAG TPA: hypothetical protein PKH58_00575 [Paludibacteraceae bacterium]|nr:hypothetical protein [Paludibacteraceae bacterium]HPT42616.1 hypothetical protein [Paludibacteraceae bacterium]